MFSVSRFLPILLTLLALFPPNLPAQAAVTVPDSLTLQDVVQMAISNNPSVERMIADHQSAEARIEQSRSRQLPVVDGNAAYARIDPVPQFVFGGQPLELAPHDNFDFHVSGRYDVYDFGKTREQTRVAESRAQNAADAVAVVRTNIIYSAIRAFHSLVFLQRSLVVQDQEIDALNQHIEIARKRVEAGTAIDYDVLSSQVKVAAVQNQRADVLNQLERQRTALRELLGLPSSAQVNAKGEVNPEPAELNRDSLTATALEQRPEMRVARDAETAAQMQRKLVNVSDLPVLRANVQYGVKNGYEPNLNAWRGNWAGVAELQVPIYDGSLNRYQKQEADAALRSQQYQREALERQIQSDVDRALNDVNTATEKLQISDVRIQQATDAITIARARYTNGTMTNVDVLDAETSLAEAQLVREQAVYLLEIARAALDQAVGATKWQR